MIRVALQTCLTVLALLISASVTMAAACDDDPNECTLKKLCEVATTVDGGNTIWPTATGSTKHVALAQRLGISQLTTSQLTKILYLHGLLTPFTQKN